MTTAGFGGGTSVGFDTFAVTVGVGVGVETGAAVLNPNILRIEPFFKAGHVCVCV